MSRNTSREALKGGLDICVLQSIAVYSMTIALSDFPLSLICLCFISLQNEQTIERQLQSYFKIWQSTKTRLVVLLYPEYLTEMPPFVALQNKMCSYSFSKQNRKNQNNVKIYLEGLI